MASWAKSAKTDATRELAGADLDLAVARGAAYYAAGERGRGRADSRRHGPLVLHRRETNDAGGAGVRPADQARSASRRSAWKKGHRGGHSELRSRACVVGTEAEFRFLGSTVRREDAAGTVVEDWQGQVDELGPVRTTLEAARHRGSGQDRAGPPAQQGHEVWANWNCGCNPATASRSGSWSSTPARGSRTRGNQVEVRYGVY